MTSDLMLIFLGALIGIPIGTIGGAIFLNYWHGTD